MANKKHLEILAKGVIAWNEWRKDQPGAVPDLFSANLSGANLYAMRMDGACMSGANLSDANLFAAHLRGAHLAGTDVRNANLNFAHLNGAHLEGANLSFATLNSADLSGAHLRGANLRGTNLNLADLNGADLTDASLCWTVFGNLDLRNVKGLEMVCHAGPTTIGVETIYRSQGTIPECFLRGAGVPENLITYMKSLAGTGFDFYSCFISYSTKDQEFAGRVYADLQARGVRCWFAPRDIQGGRKVHEQIDEAIRVHDKLLLILSDASMSSNWVKTEIANARAREQQQKRRMLFPISIVPFEIGRAHV